MIAGAGLDGSSITAIVSEDIDDPNGIAVDYEMEVVYWVDGILDRLERCAYNGR